MKTIDWIFVTLIFAGLLASAYFLGYSNGHNESNPRDTVTVVTSVPAVPVYDTLWAHDTLWLPAKVVQAEPQVVEGIPLSPIDTASVLDNPITSADCDSTIKALKIQLFNLRYPVGSDTRLTFANDSARARVSFMVHISYYPERRKFAFTPSDCKIEYPYTTITLSPLETSGSPRIWQRAVGIVGLGGVGYSIAKQSWLGVGVSVLLVGVGSLF